MERLLNPAGARALRLRFGDRSDCCGNVRKGTIADSADAGPGVSRLQIAAGHAAIVVAEEHHPVPGDQPQKARENGTIGIDEVTEYFLVGSFASWIVALGGLALAR